jgi:Effector-associated domain 11
MMTTLQDKLRELIAKNKTQQALFALSEQLQGTEEGDTITLLHARLNRNRGDYNQGVISNSDYSMETNRINYALLSLIGDLESTSSGGQKSVQQKAVNTINNIYNTLIIGEINMGDKPYTYIAGDNVAGDKIGRDKILGDKIINKSSKDTNVPPFSALKKKSVLFIAAEPESKRSFNAGKEVQRINEALDRSSDREKYEILTDFASKPDDLYRLLKRHNPAIVHFSMHGSEAGVFFEDSNGNAVSVAPDILGGFFELINDGDSRIVECVIMSACNSTNHAKVISEFVGSAIGMNGSILAEAAREYTKGFYQSFFEGDDYKVAHRFGVLLVKQFASRIKYLGDIPLAEMPQFFTSIS